MKKVFHMKCAQALALNKAGRDDKITRHKVLREKKTTYPLVYSVCCRRLPREEGISDVQISLSLLRRSGKAAPLCF